MFILIYKVLGRKIYDLSQIVGFSTGHSYYLRQGYYLFIGRKNPLHFGADLSHGQDKFSIIFFRYGIGRSLSSAVPYIVTASRWQ